MKIVITESQLKRIVSENRPLTKSEYEERLNKSIELAKNFPNPRQFELKHPILGNFLRVHKLLDLAFPNRKKHNENLTDEKALKIASRYTTGTDLNLDYPSIYDYLYRKKLMKKAFPNSDENTLRSINYSLSLNTSEDDPNFNPTLQNYFDYLMDRASTYHDMEDLKKRNPVLYDRIRQLGHGIHFDSDSEELFQGY